jgi:hypothetical protein
MSITIPIKSIALRQGSAIGASSMLREFRMDGKS